MDCSLHIFTTWAKSQQNGDAIFNGPDPDRDLAGGEFLSRIRANCGVAENRKLPEGILKAIDSAQVAPGKPLSARAIKLVSSAALAWEREVNRLGNRIVDSCLSAEAKDSCLKRLVTVTTREQLEGLEREIFGTVGSGNAVRPNGPRPYPFGAGELFPKLGDKSACFRQSMGANTCFAMSVMNGCSHSAKLAGYLNEKYKELPHGLQLHYPQDGFRSVQIEKEYRTLAGKLGSFENTVVNYMCAADQSYRNAMTGQRPDTRLPYGNSVVFGKALGLVQNQPDVMIMAQDEIPDVPGRNLSAESFEKVRDRIASQLQQGGVVTMNIGNGHYVAITGIDGETVTIVDSLGGALNGPHSLREFSGKVADDYGGAYTFSFLDLPDETGMAAFLENVRTVVGKNDVLAYLVEKTEVPELKNTIARLAGQLKLQIDPNAEIDFNAVIDTLHGLMDEAVSAINDKVRADKAKEPYEQLETALVQLRNAREAKQIVGEIQDFNAEVSEFLRYLGESSDGRQFSFEQMRGSGDRNAVFDEFVRFAMRHAE